MEIVLAKIGEGSLKAALRQGAKEASQGIVAFPATSIQPVQEPGGFWTPPQAEVAQQTGVHWRDRSHEREPPAPEM